MRGAVEGLTSPFPLLLRLPAPYHDDELAAALTGGFDELLAPAISTLDNFAAYLDPSVTPPDLLDWLGHCVGADLDAAWSVTERRAVVAGAVLGHRRRGTVATLVDGLRRVAGLDVDVTEGGGSAISATPEGELPGTGSAVVTVTVYLPAGRTDEDLVLDRLRSAARRLIPAHLMVSVTARPAPRDTLEES